MGKFTEFKLPLKTLAPGVHKFDYHLGKVFFDNMENTDIHDADLNVALTVTYDGHRYDLLFKIEGQVVLLCDRCLDDLDFPIEAEYHVKVEYGEDYNDDVDDLLVIPEGDSSLNLAYMIYDTVVLAIPIKHVHPMGKCNRQMSAVLRKHRVNPVGEDADLENELMDEMDAMEGSSQSFDSDPRWDALKNLNTEE